ncbi:MAG: type II toxin-antitoxin system CcdA family antitoxin [Candidatus Parvarchaeota archaeon]
MKSTITITVDSEVMEKLRRLEVNKSSLINDFLKDYVERHKDEIGKYPENPEKEKKVDPTVLKKMSMLKSELMFKNWKIPDYYLDKPDLLDIYKWDEAKSFAVRFEMKTDIALQVIDEYLHELEEKKKEKSKQDQEKNESKSTSMNRIQVNNVLNSTIK